MPVESAKNFLEKLIIDGTFKKSIAELGSDKGFQCS